MFLLPLVACFENDILCFLTKMSRRDSCIAFLSMCVVLGNVPHLFFWHFSKKPNLPIRTFLTKPYCQQNIQKIEIVSKCGTVWNWYVMNHEHLFMHKRKNLCVYLVDKWTHLAHFTLFNALQIKTKPYCKI